MKDYEKQAEDFLAKTGSTLTAVFFKKDKYFPEDDMARDIYTVTLQRGQRKYIFNFGQSIANSEHWVNKRAKWPSAAVVTDKNYALRTWGYDNTKHNKGKVPTAYDILTCLTKYNPGMFEDFCSEFGYDTDSRRAFDTYQKVVEEYLQVSAIWSESDLEELREIE